MLGDSSVSETAHRYDDGTVIKDPSLEKRARQYLAGVPVPVESTRKKTISAVALYLESLVNECGQSMDAVQIVELMLEWARHTGLEEMGVVDTCMAALAKVTRIPREPHRLMLNSLSIVSSERSFRGVPAGDVLDQALGEIDWLIDGVFSSGQPTILGGKQKTMKTTVLADLAVALATGTPWLNHFRPPRKRRVLLITGESSQRAAMERIRRAAEFRKIATCRFRNRLRLEATHFPSLRHLEDCQAIQKAVTDLGIDVVILDPLYMGLGGVNTTNLNEVGPAMRQFQEHCYPASVIIAHHIKKSAKFERAPELDGLAQAGIAEFAGNYWLMGRLSAYEGGGTHSLAVRFGGRDEQFGLLSLRFNERSWQAEWESLHKLKQVEKLQKTLNRTEEMKKRIRMALSGHPEGLSLSALADACGTKRIRTSFKSSLAALAQAKVIELLRVNSGGKQCDGARLA